MEPGRQTLVLTRAEACAQYGSAFPALFGIKGTRMRLSLAAVLCTAVLSVPVPSLARDNWIEVKSAHFTVISNAGERRTRTLVWQLEQVRSTMVTLWSWARPDLHRPLTVIAVKDENSMLALVPKYREERGEIRLASVWTTGADRHYLAIRTDIDVDSQGTINPHLTAYFSYINLVMDQSLSPDLPLWLSRGLSGVLSNTLVRNDHVVVGAPIPRHLETLRERPRTALAKLLTLTRNSPELGDAHSQGVFDAQVWAFVHFLMFANNSAYADELNAFAARLSKGDDPSAAFRETLGTPESLENAFRVYFNRPTFVAHRFNIDVAVERERFPVRTLSAAESESVRALFHVAISHPGEARLAIAAARKSDPKAPGSHEAEGLLLDREGKGEEARLALARAVEYGSSNAYVHYRLASLTWRRDADQATLKAIEGHLAKAIALNTRYAHAYSWLGEIRSLLGTGEASGLVMRAISLEPQVAAHRLRAASVLGRQRKFEEAAAQAQAALALAETDDERRGAQELLDRINKNKATADNAQK